MKAIKIALVMILVLNVIYSVHNWLFSEDSRTSQVYSSQQYSQPVEEQQAAAAEGLSLLGLTALVKEIRSGQELERRLNETDGINNLDLNEDGKVDYLNVREFGDINKKIGYSVTTEPAKGEIQEIAEISIEKNGDKAEIQVIGNEQIYGSDAIYNDSTTITRAQSADVVTGSHGTPLYSSFFYPHPLWISPWLFGFYPPFFSPYGVVSRSAYVSRTNRYNTSTVRSGQNSFQKTSPTKLQNPNKGKAANKGITRSLRKPTASQKSFQTTQRKNIKSGGFGQASRPASTGTGLSRSSGTSQKSGSVFGSRSSIFGSRSSSSGSFRSKSFGSRSFSFGK
ncbi:hypothetical protein KJ966_23785 [bacterium]|nr:hypothetical protein [bacterium]